ATILSSATLTPPTLISVTSAAPAIPADSSNADTATNALQQFVRIRSSLVHSSLVRRIILTDANHTSAGSERGQPIVPLIGPAVFDRYIPALDITGFAQALAERHHERQMTLPTRC